MHSSTLLSAFAACVALGMASPAPLPPMLSRDELQKRGTQVYATPAGDAQCEPINPHTGERIGNYDPDNLLHSVGASEGGYLADLADNGACTVRPGPNACQRVLCGNTSAVYMCNDNDYEITADCRTVADTVRNKMAAKCVCGQYTCATASAFQRFEGNWSLFVGYGNCNKDPSLGPFDQ